MGRAPWGLRLDRAGRFRLRQCRGLRVDELLRGHVGCDHGVIGGADIRRTRRQPPGGFECSQTDVELHEAAPN